MTSDLTDHRIVAIIAAAMAAEPDQVTVQTVRLVLDHDGNPEELAAALIANEI